MVEHRQPGRRVQAAAAERLPPHRAPGCLLICMCVLHLFSQVWLFPSFLLLLQYVDQVCRQNTNTAQQRSQDPNLNFLLQQIFLNQLQGKHGMGASLFGRSKRAPSTTGGLLWEFFQDLKIKDALEHVKRAVPDETKCSDRCKVPSKKGVKEESRDDEEEKRMDRKKNGRRKREKNNRLKNRLVIFLRSHSFPFLLRQHCLPPSVFFLPLCFSFFFFFSFCFVFFFLFLFWGERCGSSMRSSTRTYCGTRSRPRMSS